MKVLFIGFGNMGSVLGKTFIKKGVFSKENLLIAVRSEERKRKLKREGYNIVENLKKGVLESDLIFIAVKPKDLEKVLKEIKDFVNGKIIITIVAGFNIEYYQNILGKKVKIVRAMPNINYEVSKGLIALTFSENFTEEEKKNIKEIFSKISILVEEIDENFMNAFTALAGSLPAFISEILDALAVSGVYMGFTYDKALNIVLATMEGTIEYLKRKKILPEAYRNKIMSPAGTTVKGIRTLYNESIKGKIIEVILDTAQIKDS
jgi:pyrroline-5-carboxylate reductase